MTQSWLPWAVFVLGMFMVWSTVFAKTASFRKSTLAALLVGKTSAIAYRPAGPERTVLTTCLAGKYSYAGRGR